MSNAAKRWRRAGIASAATTALVASGLTAFAGAASASEPVDFERIAGDNRYETSVEAAEAFGPTDNALLASGEQGHYVDALSGNFLAGVRTAPILLTREDRLPEPVKAHLESSTIDAITILGGELAVSAAVEAELEAMGITVTRLEGQNRYLTNEAIIDAGAAEAADTALIATGENFPDALGAGPVSYAGKMPVGLTKLNDIPDFVVQSLLDAGVDKALVLGGQLAVSDEVVEELESKGIDVVERLEGRNRSLTSIEVAEWAIANLDFSDSEVDFASGRELSEGIDALSGGPVSGKEGVPILITVNEERAPQLVDYLETNCQRIDEGDIYGGPLAVSVDLEEELEAAAQCETNQDFAADPAGAVQVVAGDEQDVVFSGIDVANVDLALINCDNVTVTNGNVVFADVDNDGLADVGDVTGFSITEINGITSAFGTSEDNVTVPTNGTVNVTLDTTPTADNCVVLVAFDDADDDDRIDLNADNTPTDAEVFAVTGDVTAVNPTAVDASPEFELNRFGDQHTVTAQLEDADGDPVAVAGVPVRFRLNESTVPQVNDNGGEFTEAEQDGTLTVIEVANVTTNDQGVATFTFTAQDPQPNVNNPDEGFVVEVLSDINGDGAFIEDDTVGKNFTDETTPVATSLDATPESEVNQFGDNHTITATVLDQFGDPVAGDQVTFTVNTGDARPDLSGTRTTDANGVATFTYQGPADPNANAFNASVTDTITVDTDTTPADDVTKTFAEGVASVDGETFDNLEAAIAAAEAGDTITTAGDFQDAAVVVDKAVTIDGQGNSRLIGGFDVVSDNVTIKGFRVESDTVGIEVFTGGFTGLTFSNNTITGPAADTLDTGIFFNPASAGTVSGNTIIDALSGVATDTDGTVSITGNTFQNNEEGVGVGGVNVGISGNTFTTNDATDIYVNAYVPVSDAYLNQVAANNSFTPAAEVDYTNDEVEPVGP